MKNFKFISSAFLSAVVMFGLVSCGGNGSRISKGDIEDAFEDISLMRDSSMTVTFKTGYYEVDAQEYMSLQRLINAKLVTAKFEVQDETFLMYSTYSYTANAEVVGKHMFATVSLTEEGKKYVVNNDIEKYNNRYKDVYEKLFPEKDKKKKKAPEYMTVSDEAKKYYEKAVGEEINEIDDEADITEDSSIDKSSSNDEYIADNDYDSDYENPYKEAKKKEKIEKHNVLLGSLKVDEVYDIISPAKYQEVGKAYATVLVKIVDPTPFYYILNHSSSDFFTFYVTLQKFKDSGWAVTKSSISSYDTGLFFDESNPDKHKSPSIGQLLGL